MAALLEDVLYEFAFSDMPLRERLEDFIRRYPEHHDELVDFAVEYAVDAIRGEDEE